MVRTAISKIVTALGSLALACLVFGWSGCGGSGSATHLDAGSSAEVSDANAGSDPGMPDAAVRCSMPPFGTFGEYDRMTVGGGCEPVGFTGTGRVRRIERSDPGGVYVIDIALDARGSCGPDVPAGIEILYSRVSWGLEIGSQVHVRTFGGGDHGFMPERMGAVVSRPDGSLLAAAFDQTEEFLAAFLDALPFGVSFQPECAAEPAMHQGHPCHRSVLRESMRMADGSVLRVGEDTKIAVADATFHLRLRHARNNMGPTGGCPGIHRPADGRSYGFHVLRLP